MSDLFVVASFLLLVATVVLVARLRQAKRAAFVRTAPLPADLLDRLAARRPELSLKDRQLVARGLRKFFLVVLEANGRPVAMPSRVVDDLWREFTLEARDYRLFCKRAFGRVLPHTPAVALGRDAAQNEGLRRCWWLACREENIDPARATRVPLLFALDRKLGVPDGFRYAAAPTAATAPPRDSGGDGFTVEREYTYTPADFQDLCYDGTTTGFGDGDGDASGDGGGGD